MTKFFRNNPKDRKFHHNLIDWVNTIDNNIDRLVHFCENPDNPTMELDIMEINIYQKIRSLLTGGDDCTFTQEMWDYHCQAWSDAQNLGKDFKFKDLKKEIKSLESEIEEVTLPFMANAPEIEEELHLLNMEEIPVKKKKKSKPV